MTVLGVAGGVAFPNGLPVLVSGVLRVRTYINIHINIDTHCFLLGIWKFFLCHSPISVGPSNGRNGQ